MESKGIEMVLTETDVTVPADTEKTDPSMERVTLPYPVITRFSILIPEGNRALARMAVFYGEAQIFPHRYGVWLTGNGETVTDEPYLDLGGKEPVINIRGYNTDTAYPHTFYVRIGVQPKYIAMWRQSIWALAKTMQMRGF